MLQPRLPVHVNTHRFGGGRPRIADRDCADAIFYMLRTGCQWQALDQTELCAHSTAHDRFQEWVEADVFLTLWQGGDRFRRLLIRWDKKPENYLAFLHFACGLIALRAAGLFG